MSANRKLEGRNRRHLRIRSHLSGTPERPRLSIFLSNRFIYVQLIDDLAGKTLAAASTKADNLKGLKANKEGATEVGKKIAEIAQTKNITKVVFDRSGYKFHGKVKALAEAARSAGLQF